MSERQLAWGSHWHKVPHILADCGNLNVGDLPPPLAGPMRVSHETLIAPSSGPHLHLFAPLQPEAFVLAAKPKMDSISILLPKC